MFCAQTSSSEFIKAPAARREPIAVDIGRDAHVVLFLILDAMEASNEEKDGYEMEPIAGMKSISEHSIAMVCRPSRLSDVGTFSCRTRTLPIGMNDFL